jgi:uncharacterized membrane protein YeaQ/YmgE (transglycosylase-associated protein family)
MGLISIMLLGLLAGWISGSRIESNRELIWDLILGGVGALVGSCLTSAVLGVEVVLNVNIPSLVVAVLSAMVLVAAYHLVMGRRVTG